MRHPIPFAILIAAACGPTVATDDDATTDTPQVTTGDTAATGETGATVNTDAPTTDAVDTTDTDAIDDACVSGDPAACPQDCYRGYAWQVIDDACGVNSVEMCLPGGPKPGLPSTTYWAQTSAGPVFAEYGGPCSAAARPDMWHECSGAVDEPAECACFCQGGYCLGDEDRRALDECALPWPCDPLLVDPQQGAFDHAVEACVLEGLGARTPGVYEVITSGGFSTATTRFYVFGADDVARIELMSDDVVSCPETSDWGSASRCTLASEAFFASCFEPLPEGEECVLAIDAWVSECDEGRGGCG
jgi:hypothetical protein